MNSQERPLDRNCKTLPIMFPKLVGETADSNSTSTPLARDCKTLGIFEPNLAKQIKKLRFKIELTPAASQSSAVAALGVMSQTDCSPLEMLSALRTLVDLGAVSSIKSDIANSTTSTADAK